MDENNQQPLDQLRHVRIDKLNKLKELGINPYPSKANRTELASVISKDFLKLEGKKVVVTGRIMSWREHGMLVFSDLQDISGQVQLYIKKDVLHKFSKKKQILGFEELDLLDIGDFIQVEGLVTKTQRGEVSVQAEEIKLLTKSLRPIPAKEGLKDRETKMRRRYLDTTVNRDVLERFIRRAKFWEAHREFFVKNKFFEINIPVLEAVTGGADAKPFITHMDALDTDFYLRISQELYLKRLIGGGYEKVYEIGPRFRNEGLSDEHLPEHIGMEFYWAYADWREGMKFVEDLFSYVIKKVYKNKTEFSIRGFDVDFGKGWKVLDFSDIMKEQYGVDVYSGKLSELESLLKKDNLEVPYPMSRARAVDILWKAIRGTIAGPVFLINHPIFLSPLPKPYENNPNIAERFQPIIAGSELGNGWSELNNPLDQYARFKEQQDLRDKGDSEAQMMDIDYVEMLEYGMPPTFGYGHSERVFWFLENVSAREGVPFPQLKHEIDDTTRKIYGIN